MAKATTTGQRTYVVARKYIVEVQAEVQANSLAEAVGKMSNMTYDDFTEYGEQLATADETVWLRDSITEKV